jgi:hypothetical protein
LLCLSGLLLFQVSAVLTAPYLRFEKSSQKKDKKIFLTTEILNILQRAWVYYEISLRLVTALVFKDLDIQNPFLFKTS